MNIVDLVLPPEVLSLLEHGGPAAVVAMLLGWLFLLERKEKRRLAAENKELGGLVRDLTREIVKTTSDMVHATEDNTEATVQLGRHITDLGTKFDHFMARRPRS